MSIVARRAQGCAYIYIYEDIYMSICCPSRAGLRMAALRLWWARWLPASPNGRILQRIALRCHHRCNRLQRAVVCCNGPWSNATARGLLQQSAQCCHRCNRLQPAWPMAPNCGLLQQFVLCCIGPDCCGTHCSVNSAATCCSGLWSIATDRTALQSLQQVAMGCGPLQQVALRCNTCCAAAGSVAPRQAALRCNRLLRCGTDCCCNRRCAVATDAHQCWLRRRTTMLSAVATRDALLQQTVLSCSCSASSHLALLQHACATATDGQQRWLRRRTNLLSAAATCGAPLQQTALSCSSPALSH
jgi:hypothetical protein